MIDAKKYSKVQVGQDDLDLLERVADEIRRDGWGGSQFAAERVDRLTSFFERRRVGVEGYVTLFDGRRLRDLRTNKGLIYYCKESGTQFWLKHDVRERFRKESKKRLYGQGGTFWAKKPVFEDVLSQDLGKPIDRDRETMVTAGKEDLEFLEAAKSQIMGEGAKSKCMRGYLAAAQVLIQIGGLLRESVEVGVYLDLFSGKTPFYSFVDTGRVDLYLNRAGFERRESAYVRGHAGVSPGKIFYMIPEDERPVTSFGEPLVITDVSERARVEERSD